MTIEAETAPKIDSSRLVKTERLAELLFSDDCRPRPRTISEWRYKRVIPYYRIRGVVYFDPDEVRAALRRKNYIRCA